MIRFKDTKVWQILKERWTGKDMETYFIQKNKEFIERLKNEREMKQNNRDRQREFSYKVVGWSILIFVGFTIFSSLIRLIFH